MHYLTISCARAGFYDYRSPSIVLYVKERANIGARLHSADSDGKGSCLIRGRQLNCIGELLLASWNRHHGAYALVLKRLNDEGPQLLEGRVVAVNHAEGDGRIFRLGVVLSMTECVGQRIA